MKRAIFFVVAICVVGLGIYELQRYQSQPVIDRTSRPRLPPSLPLQVSEELLAFSYFVQGLSNDPSAKIPSLTLKDLMYSNSVKPEIKSRLRLYDDKELNRGARRSWDYRVNPELVGREFNRLEGTEILILIRDGPDSMRIPIGIRVNGDLVFRDQTTNRQ